MEVHKIILKQGEDTLMPITRGELVLDSSGYQAFRSDEFIATQEYNGLFSSKDKTQLDNISQEINQLKQLIVEKSCEMKLSTEWKASGITLQSPEFESGTYVIQIMVDELVFSGIASIYVGNVDCDDEIVLHACGKSGVVTRLYAKIKPNGNEVGELFFAASQSIDEDIQLLIKLKKLL